MVAPCLNTLAYGLERVSDFAPGPVDSAERLPSQMTRAFALVTEKESATLSQGRSRPGSLPCQISAGMASFAVPWRRDCSAKRTQEGTLKSGATSHRSQ